MFMNAELALTLPTKLQIETYTKLYRNSLMCISLSLSLHYIFLLNAKGKHLCLYKM